MGAETRMKHLVWRLWRAGLPTIPAPRADAGSDGLEVR